MALAIAGDTQNVAVSPTPFAPNGPYGAKGVGETATFCVSPAIANAIEDACGVRLMELPLNAEAVFRALRAKNNKPLGDEP